MGVLGTSVCVCDCFSIVINTLLTHDTYLMNNEKGSCVYYFEVGEIERWVAHLSYHLIMAGGGLGSPTENKDFFADVVMTYLFFIGELRKKEKKEKKKDSQSPTPFTTNIPPPSLSTYMCIKEIGCIDIIFTV
jgi:hypothetical protein